MDSDAVDPEPFLLSEARLNRAPQTYEVVQHHWFHRKLMKSSKEEWFPFSYKDSKALEDQYLKDGPADDKIVATDGGRYDVNIGKRLKFPVYWPGEPTEVRRCSWFYKGSTTSKYLPYSEDVAQQLEKEYQNCFEKNEWHKKVKLPNGDTIVFHSYDVLVLFPPSLSVDDWSNSSSQVRPRVIRRGVEEFDIDEGEPDTVDHILFMVHGIGSVCDLKFRTVHEVVDEFRNISLQLLRAHYQTSYEQKLASRLEVLPISWHNELHSEDTGIDKTLKSITLESIPRLRSFTNDTLLDILFYTSPKYCQKIVSTVGDELNRIYKLFKSRNPTFEGKVFLGGHSLGSLILFDLLSHQQPMNQDDPSDLGKKLDRRISYMYGAVGSGIARIHYPQLCFPQKALFAMGSPIGMFVTVRGLDSLGKDFALPNCESFFNIFHPYDPVAYRIESLINPKLASLKPMLIPHHKGRKRMHLELKETLSRVGADLKQKVIDSVKHTWNTLFQMGVIHAEPNELDDGENTIQEESSKDIEETPENFEKDESFGILNRGRRIDYVLQESPFEIFNEYVFSLSSHVCYWDSEDTMLFILREVYSSMNLKPDSQIPQATMTIERPLDAGSRRGSFVSSYISSNGNRDVPHDNA